MQNLEYRWDNPGQFSFFTMSNHGEMELCNPMQFWISFERLQIITFYDVNQMGVFTINTATLNPSSSTLQEGGFLSEDLSASQHIFMILDFEFDGGNIRLDPNQLMVIVQADMPILGIIPYSSTTQMSGFNFDKMMNAEDLTCD